MPEFDEKYVKDLRNEAAQWRTKYRELEANGLYKDVEVEMAKRGVKADPSWVTVSEGQSVEDAVSELIAKHPNLTPSTPTQPSTNEVEVPRKRVPQAPRVMSPGARHPEAPTQVLKERSLQEVKKDPVARSQLRDLYRALLTSSSNQPNHEY